jgi:hypothetical protein
MVFVFFPHLPKNTWIMETTSTTVSTIELKQLIHSLAKHPTGIFMRYRIRGGLWYPNFLKVMDIRDGGAILFRDTIRQANISLSDLSIVAQFELDGRFGNYEPECHYHVTCDDLYNDH